MVPTMKTEQRKVRFLDLIKPVDLADIEASYVGVEAQRKAAATEAAQKALGVGAPDKADTVLDHFIEEDAFEEGDQFLYTDRANPKLFGLVGSFDEKKGKVVFAVDPTAQLSKVLQDEGQDAEDV